MTSFLNTAENTTTHEVNMGAAQRWYDNYVNNGVLDELGFKSDFRELIKSKRDMEYALTNIDNYNKSILAKVLNADPEHAIDVAMSGNTKNNAHAMRSMMQSLKSPDKALEASAKKGLKRSFIDFIFSKTQKELGSEAAREAGVSPIVMSQKRKTLMNQYGGALRELFKDEPHKLKALNNYQMNAEVLLRNTRAPGSSGGSETKELLSQKFANIAYQGFGPKAKTARILTEHFRKKYEAEVNKIIQRAMFDPDYAFTLVNKNMKPEVFSRRMARHIQEIGSLPKSFPIREGSKILQETTPAQRLTDQVSREYLANPVLKGKPVVPPNEALDLMGKAYPQLTLGRMSQIKAKKEKGK